MARSPLTNLVADVVDDRLRAEGFTRRGKVWYAANECGDHVLVELRVMPRLPGMEHFLVNTGVVPTPWWSWMRALAPSGRRAQPIPDIADALLNGQFSPPDGGPVGLGWTVSNRAEAARIGEQVADLLAAGTVQRLRALLDRPRLYAELIDRNVRTPAVRAAFAAEQGPGAELDDLLAQYAAWAADNHEFLAWAKAYAAEHAEQDATRD